MKQLASILIALTLLAAPAAGELFVGLESAGVLTRVSDMSGFPNVTYGNLWAFEVSGAAATPDRTLYLCNGAFTTKLYRGRLTSPPQFVANISVDIHALAYGNGKLYGYSNFAATKGIYEIDTTTGAATLILDVYTGTGFRFFALDFNPRDGLLYGYTEYGDSGLYSINLATGEMIKFVDPPPAVNGQGRGMAVGNNTVYLVATRGDEGEPCFAYDLRQGPNGQWVGFTNPYPDYHSTGGGAWLPTPGLKGDLNCDGVIDNEDIDPFVLALTNPAAYNAAWPNCDIMNADVNNDGVVDNEDIDPFVELLTGP